ncbi:MAG: orotidine-5'-phosphate decarboxylase [Candidatus Cloacimonetes bacterium]|nr:orotidine-5'-phosphate decarboxylase [Candidatus Cloacimonadota bacterium]
MARIRSKSFWTKFQTAYKKKKTLVCVGLDTDVRQLPQCVRMDRNPIYSFNKAIIEATLPYAIAYKPNLAFYLAAGVKGLEALKLTIEAIPSDTPVILDCKVGDIGNTMESYLKAFFEEMGCDAITVNPLMGKDVIRMILNETRYFAFALTLTSNPSAKDFLLKKELYKDIAEWINGYDIQQMGAVVGATQPDYLQKIRKLLPEQLFLIPGIGTQGGDLEAVLEKTVKSARDPGILINSSRGIIFKDSTANFADAAAKETAKLRDKIRTKVKN